MNIRILILSLALVFSSCAVIAQKQPGKITITADFSGSTRPLAASKFAEWKGDTEVVPYVIKGHSPSWDQMGAEYLIFSKEGTAEDPKNDSIPGGSQKIYRKKAKADGKIYTWSFLLRAPTLVANESLVTGRFLLLPGDSIHITFDQGKVIYSGRGGYRLQVLNDVNAAIKDVAPAIRTLNKIDLSIFYNANDYLNQQLDRSMAILKTAKSKLNHYEYDWIKAVALARIEDKRSLDFIAIWGAKNRNPELPYSKTDLIKAWDSIMYKPDALWLRSSIIQNMPGIGDMGYSKNFHTIELARKFNFVDNDSVSNSPVFKKQLYYLLKSAYTGLYRERVLCYFLDEEVIQEMGAPYNWFAKTIMNDYYSIPGFSAYKNWMKKLEKSKEERYKGVSGSGAIPLFHLEDQNGLSYSLGHTVGKVTIVNFWYTGSESCKILAVKLKHLQKRFKADTNVLFLNVSVDTDKQLWLKSIKEGIYVPGGMQLYTGGNGKNHEMIKDFYVSNYPTLRMYTQKIYDKRAYIIFDDKEPFATALDEKKLVTLIERHLSKFDDGPYVFHENGNIRAYTIDDDQVNEASVAGQLRSSSDNLSRPLQFSLKKGISIPESTYPNASKLLVLSDIEGNFTPFKRLLQANGIMDENFNWKFGKGHLVFAGDMFDRGDQVTECLWLVYSLEEKAKTAGGMVHFILGNHEIMNLQGNHRYVVSKYKKNAELMGKTLTQLYNEDSEFGRWLRSKNIVEKIGDLLFMHGGVSSELNKTPVTIAKINELARPHYADTTRKHIDRTLNTIMSSEVGPFWFRGYYDGLAIENMIDSTFKKFDVKHIITGHTIVADTISVHYSGKIINTDVRHASGKSEALLIEGNNFYRVNYEGKRVFLFTDDKRKTSGK